MVPSRQVEIPFCRGIGQQCGRGFSALAQVIGRAAIKFLRKNIVPAAKCVGVDLLEFAVSEIADAVSGRKFSRLLQRVWEVKLWENICVVMAGKKVQTESFQQICKTNQTVAKRHFHKHSSLIMSSNFRYQAFVAGSGNLGGRIPVDDDVLSSHEQELYPTTWHDENCKKYKFQQIRTDTFIWDRPSFETEICQKPWLRKFQ